MAALDLPAGVTIDGAINPGFEKVLTKEAVAFVAELQRKSFVARFPELAAVSMEYSWGGRLCLTLNNVPVFGEIEDGLFSACAENGLGTVKSTLAGVLAVDLAAGIPSEMLASFKHLPAPKRLPPEPFAWLGINGVMRWQELRAGREA